MWNINIWFIYSKPKKNSDLEVSDTVNSETL
jgi:hypothetical protein